MVPRSPREWSCCSPSVLLLLLLAILGPSPTISREWIPANCSEDTHANYTEILPSCDIVEVNDEASCAAYCNATYSANSSWCQEQTTTFDSFYLAYCLCESTPYAGCGK